MIRVGVLASHGGSTLQALIDAMSKSDLPINIALVLSNNSKSGAIERAREQGIATAHISQRTHPDDDARDTAICEALQAHDVQVVVLAGYMKRLGARTLAAFEHHMLNTHPSLLPKYGGAGFYGLKVHEAVIEAGDRESGATVHLVAEEYDTGPIVAQVTVPVRPTDTPVTLQERVKRAEKRLLVQVLREWSANLSEQTSEPPPGKLKGPVKRSATAL